MPEKSDEKQPNVSESDKSPPKQPRGKPWHRRPGIVGLLLLVLAAAIIGGVLFWRHSRSRVTTDDASIDVVSEQVSPQIAGRILRVLVNDNQDVTAGQTLVEIDPADLQARVDQGVAARGQAAAQVAEAQAQEASIAAQVEEARAKELTAKARLTNANHQLGRYRQLKSVNAGAVSGQQMDAAVAAQTTAAAELVAAQKAAIAAQAQVGYVHSQVAAARAGVTAAESQLHQARLTLSYATVKARVAGRVAMKTVSAGNVVAPGTPLMAIVPREVYVTANFKETQLRRMRVGQPAEVKVDAWPDMKLAGRVDSIEPATGAAFSTLPAQNATGNWVKIVQRVPVKIVFDRLPDDPDRRLGPGMSVNVAVRIR